jgi:hypothetical protein
MATPYLTPMSSFYTSILSFIEYHFCFADPLVILRKLCDKKQLTLPKTEAPRYLNEVIRASFGGKSIFSRACDETQ